MKKEKFLHQYSTILKELDHSHPTRYMYYPIFLIRRLVFVVLLVFLAESPVIQIILMSATALIMGAYIVIFRPQHEKVMLFLNTISEFLLIALHLLSFVFLEENIQQDRATEMGWIVNVLMLILWA